MLGQCSRPAGSAAIEVGEHQGQLFVAMEYIEGVSLTRWLADESLTWFEIIDLFVRAGRGLQAAHEAGVVHRDFKPDNVMIQRSELRPAPMLADVPAWALETLTRALALDPQKRWGSMAELLDALTHHPDRTANPELDRTVALNQRLWMLSVMSLGTFGMVGVS